MLFCSRNLVCLQLPQASNWRKQPPLPQFHTGFLSADNELTSGPVPPHAGIPRTSVILHHTDSPGMSNSSEKRMKIFHGRNAGYKGCICVLVRSRGCREGGERCSGGGAIPPGGCRPRPAALGLGALLDRLREGEPPRAAAVTCGHCCGAVGPPLLRSVAQAHMTRGPQCAAWQRRAGGALFSQRVQTEQQPQLRSTRRASRGRCGLPYVLPLCSV